MNILDIFYNEILEEAVRGRIECFFFYNMIFNTIIEESDTRYYSDNNYKDVIVPTLIIKNKKLFDELLVEYVNKCLMFYDDSNFVFDDEYNNEEIKIKTILALLFANATIEDFSDPISFLKRRCDFFETTGECKYDIGESSILDCRLQIEVHKDSINNETPYQFIVKCISDSGEEYELPKLKFGISDNKAYIFAIQNKVSPEDTNFSKKINRKLYKVGEGFSKDEDNYDLYEEGNLNDITPSFLLVANIFTEYMNKCEIKDLVVEPLLLERWNSKVIANQIKAKRNGNYEELYNKQLKIQKNLTEKFIRTFLRLVYHCDNLTIIEVLENSFNLLIFNEGTMSSNNNLLNETAYMVSNLDIFPFKNK